MDVTTIFTESRKRTYTTVSQYPTNASNMNDLNKIYHWFCAELRKINDIYFYRRFFFDTVAFQNKYSFLPISTATQFSIQKILTVNVKYQQSQYDDFQPNFLYNKGDIILRIADGLTYVAKTDFTSIAVFVPIDWQQVYIGYVTALEKTFGLYDVDSLNFNYSDDLPLTNPVINPNNTNPIYIFWQDRDVATMQQALYLYPFIQDDIKQGIKIEAYVTDIDLTTASIESEILIERNYHDVLVEWLSYMIYQQQAKLNEAQAQRQAFLDIMQRCLSEITDRTYAPNLVQTPNLSQYS